MLRNTAFVGLLLLVCVSSVAGWGAEVAIAPDRMAVVDGQRTFILGLYENPKDDAVLAEAAKAGFNLVHAGEDAAALDRLHSHGLWAWINTGARIDLSEDAENRRTGIEKMVADYGKHPALLAWEVPDEALWNCWYGALCWRSDDEPAQLRQRIAALEDKPRAAELGRRLAQSETLRSAGRYAESEQLADDLWRELGETPPRPGYGLADAAARAAAMGAGMVAGYAHLRHVDPAHPVWMNHAPRNQDAQLAAFNAAADVVGCDIYPVPVSQHVGHSDLALQTVAAVGAYTARMQAAAPGKPVWMVLQGFAWADIQPSQPEEVRKELRRPTWAETRFMAYDAIVRGARGILYWGTAYIEKNSPLWTDLLKLASELKTLQPVLAAPDADLPMTVSLEETYGSVDRSVYVLPKSIENRVWLLVVNEWVNPLTYTIQGLESLNGTAYVETTTGDRATVSEDALRLTIRAHDVQVLRPE